MGVPAMAFVAAQKNDWLDLPKNKGHDNIVAPFVYL